MYTTTQTPHNTFKVLQQVITWRIVANPDDERQIIYRYQSDICNLEWKVQEKHKLNEEMAEKIGVCVSSLDVTLNKMGIQRQAYHE